MLGNSSQKIEISSVPAKHMGPYMEGLHVYLLSSYPHPQTIVSLNGNNKGLSWVQRIDDEVKMSSL